MPAELSAPAYTDASAWAALVLLLLTGRLNEILSAAESLAMTAVETKLHEAERTLSVKASRRAGPREVACQGRGLALTWG